MKLLVVVYEIVKTGTILVDKYYTITEWFSDENSHYLACEIG